MLQSPLKRLPKDGEANSHKLPRRDAIAFGLRRLHRHVMDAHTQRPGERSLRTGRWSEPGRIYLVTFATARRRPLFHDWYLAAAASAVIGVPASWNDGRLLAWVLMPDHCHALVELGERARLPKLVGRIKAKSAMRVGRARGGLGRIWQRGFHDHAVRREEDLVDFARYVVANPLRAGLVRRLSEYSYWDAVWFTGRC